MRDEERVKEAKHNTVQSINIQLSHFIIIIFSFHRNMCFFRAELSQSLKSAILELIIIFFFIFEQHNVQSIFILLIQSISKDK